MPCGIDHCGYYHTKGEANPQVGYPPARKLIYDDGSGPGEDKYRRSMASVTARLQAGSGFLPTFGTDGYLNTLISVILPVTRKMTRSAMFVARSATRSRS